MTTIIVSVGFLAQYKGTIREALTLPRSAWSMIVYSGSVGICASQTLFCLGLRRSSAAYTSLYMMLTPSVNSLLSLCLGMETRRLFKAVGIGIALLGTLLLILIMHFFQKVLIWPSIYLVLHVICMASNVLVWRKLFKDTKLLPLHMTWLSFLVATPTMLLVLVFEFILYPSYPSLSDSLEATPKMLGLIYCITIAYSINYAVMAWCVRHSAITIVSIYVSARPAFTSIISIVLDHEDMSILQGLCVATTFLGLLIATLGKKLEKKKVEADELRTQTARLRLNSVSQTLLPSEEELETMEERN